MADEKQAVTPNNIRVLFVGSGVHRVQPGDVFTRAHLAALGASETDLLARGDAELTDDAATVEPETAVTIEDEPVAIAIPAPAPIVAATAAPATAAPAAVVSEAKPAA